MRPASLTRATASARPHYFDAAMSPARSDRADIGLDVGARRSEIVEMPVEQPVQHVRIHRQLRVDDDVPKPGHAAELSRKLAGQHTE